jgi:hypothetical protein
VPDRSLRALFFYERMPYPAPLTSLDGYRDLYKNPNRRRAEFHLIWPARQARGDQEILDAAEQAERNALLEAEQKAARDARYAARKAAKKQRRQGY